MKNESDNLAAMRKEYGQQPLRREDLEVDAYRQFEQWFAHARKLQILEPNAMSLSTIGPDGFPSSRMVLLKFFDQNGFVFFTNYTSAKAKEIAASPQVSLLFPWLQLERQIRIEGVTEKVSTAESLKYFSSRPRESQIGAWISDQSSVISSKTLLINKWNELTKKFKDREIPLPSFWGGYRVRATRIEFWQGGKGRVHDRFLYSRQNDAWKIERLAP